MLGVGGGRAGPGAKGKGISGRSPAGEVGIHGKGRNAAGVYDSSGRGGAVGEIQGVEAANEHSSQDTK